MQANFESIEVNDRKSFIIFLKLYYQDLLNNKSLWENKDLKDFLEAMIRYTKDIDGYYINSDQSINPEIASWKLFADILKGTRVYE
jgi:hypothetical protein